ncbi:unnamed protein product [Dovyalis caffra]|uniref:Protein-serine/threonine phosphatase n=1 Tax=Dovyalis caffra TaxID=77055 RepID=A0AAV1SPT1_9ROSI|nr:unnamed protein product [Dovyalis caffra]
MQENKLSAVCERVLDRCLAPTTASGEGCDNMTMIVVQFKKPIGSTASADEQSSLSEPPATEPPATESKHAAIESKPAATEPAAAESKPAATESKPEETIQLCNPIRPNTFKRIAVNNCLVSSGKPLSSGSIISFSLLPPSNVEAYGDI